MHRYGGIYIDLDYSSFKCLSPLLREHCAKNPESAFVGVMPLTKPGCDGYTERTLYNAIFASTPGHPFWQFPPDQAKQTWESSRKVKDQEIRSIVGQVTGPQGLTRAANAYHAQEASMEKPALVELAAELVYPYAWYPSVLDPPGDRVEIAVHAQHDFDLNRAVQMYNNGTAYCSTWWVRLSVCWRRLN
jgi:hypothetical protein